MSTVLWYYWPFALGFIALGLFAIPEYMAIKNQTGSTFSEDEHPRPRAKSSVALTPRGLVF